ncbi:DUF4013 domain-containing protein [Natrinema soli]|uniref:DUF4013 domain-containing protein n=1 Tax=Natrinema soli TaxID=1930624 RepID=A0ABD5SV51_9EURY|nr:DUF4013 domain-containing protein [Natrinema soli]
MTEKEQVDGGEQTTGSADGPGFNGISSGDTFSISDTNRLLVDPRTGNCLLFSSEDEHALEFELVISPSFSGSLFELDRQNPLQRQYVQVIYGSLEGYVLKWGATGASSSEALTRSPITLKEGESLELAPGEQLDVRNGSTSEPAKIRVCYVPAYNMGDFIRQSYQFDAQIAQNDPTDEESSQSPVRTEGIDGPVDDSTMSSADPGIKALQTGDTRPDAIGDTFPNATGDTDDYEKRSSTWSRLTGHFDGETDPLSGIINAPQSNTGAGSAYLGGLLKSSRAPFQPYAEKYHEGLETVSDPSVDRQVLGRGMTWSQAFREALSSLRKSWRFVWGSEKKWRVLLPGSALFLLFVIFYELGIGPARWLGLLFFVFLAGYFARVCDAGISLSPTLPKMGDVIALGREGIAPAIILLIFFLFPMQILALLLTGIGLPVGGLVGAATEGNQQLETVLIVAVQYVTYGVFLLYVQERRIDTVVNLPGVARTILSLVTSKTYITGYLSLVGGFFTISFLWSFLWAFFASFLVSTTGSSATILLVLTIFGIHILFFLILYSFILVSYHYMGSYVGTRMLAATTPDEDPVDVNRADES